MVGTGIMVYGINACFAYLVFFGFPSVIVLFLYDLHQKFNKVLNTDAEQILQQKDEENL